MGGPTGSGWVPKTLRIVLTLLFPILLVIAIQEISCPQCSWPQEAWIWDHLGARFSSWHRQTEQASSTNKSPGVWLDDSSNNVSRNIPRCTLPTTRHSITTGLTSCYPSSGGIWVSELGPLELQHLSINRFDSSERSWNTDEEESFCHRLRVFGGEWYNISADEIPILPDENGKMHCAPLEDLAPVFEIRRYVGFPETGGVLVLAPDGEGRFPENMSIVLNALSMEERCMALRRQGAVFCPDFKDCSVLEDLRREPWEWAGERGFPGWGSNDLEPDWSWCGTN
ncbi:uncharacterized protein DSM5745_01048 [Aspergillus mulundensis]|uniref:Uncharacterized protein n=1 Tax=Aspergillus mulundensis TaxID=1810919 RepID=A0A3D8T585_9EURO|nr:hypothetical protein DSM5745_01048 [Aspergillus mulundensis]RDW93726.1 hypothetical protein DSM5745_01048 [Aspergillus mulundensis]